MSRAVEIRAPRGRAYSARPLRAPTPQEMLAARDRLSRGAAPHIARQIDLLSPFVQAWTMACIVVDAGKIRDQVQTIWSDALGARSRRIFSAGNFNGGLILVRPRSDGRDLLETFAPSLVDIFDAERGSPVVMLMASTSWIGRFDRDAERIRWGRE